MELDVQFVIPDHICSDDIVLQLFMLLLDVASDRMNESILTLLGNLIWSSAREHHDCVLFDVWLGQVGLSVEDGSVFVLDHSICSKDPLERFTNHGNQEVAQQEEGEYDVHHPEDVD